MTYHLILLKEKYSQNKDIYFILFYLFIKPIHQNWEKAEKRLHMKSNLWV